MNPEHPQKHSTAGNQMLDATHANSGDTPTALPVPVFNCLVYVSREPSGGVRARVANLAGFECTAKSEREALGRLVSAFKQRISELVQLQQSISWIDPPSPIEPGEQQRFIAVHL